MEANEARCAAHAAEHRHERDAHREHHEHREHHHDEHRHHGCACCHDHAVAPVASHHDHGHSHEHNHDEAGGLRAFLAPGLSLLMLVAGLVMESAGVGMFATSSWARLAWYVAAFIPVGWPVLREAAEGIADRDWFNEFTLMAIACIGAFCIGEYPEAVGVMLFYSVGETLQGMAVGRATRSISKLLDVRPVTARVARGTVTADVAPEEVHPGDIIEVRPGERVPLDGVVTEGVGLFDTSALTGESLPRTVEAGGEALAGMISTERTVRLRVTRESSESALARILDMVANASGRKAHAELFIRRFARVYTPVVILLALLVVVVPWVVSLFGGFEYQFSTWLYRALVFLVISCPCALVVSVPLAYFAGIGAASKAGILFKGGNYLEAITHINTVAFDKTGTLTTGSFAVTQVVSGSVVNARLLALMAAVEAGSSHPLARAIVAYADSQGVTALPAEGMQEVAGYGARARVAGSDVSVGSLRLLDRDGIVYPAELASGEGTIIACAVDGTFAGAVILSDTLKPEAGEAVRGLRRAGVDRVVILSGDREEIAAHFGRELGVDEARGGLLPADKAAFIEQEKAQPARRVAFVGDGINDAPVLALSDVGVAMGGLGSDAAIESADVVIQTDNPARVATAIAIGRATHSIVMQNIIGAIGVKAIVLILGTLGYASLWGAVFADVGVALLAVLNSMRIMWHRYTR
ncbi:MAG: cadmium-translocating P-type ATPase [Candidatus Amulumruptor caecigallinarius]|nr:cadmium-translocating P-type ATPase [Candidatus Amulumruptor caecigallinarius]MCM1396505.1 cadmium-translocating P-type ATPase [Candidatus Amulumruptor caecigallinarius]MCM1453437.1 cadmium-translocating P-type ATPase [bacterium]